MMAVYSFMKPQCFITFLVFMNRFSLDRNSGKLILLKTSYTHVNKLPAYWFHTMLQLTILKDTCYILFQKQKNNKFVHQAWLGEWSIKAKNIHAVPSWTKMTYPFSGQVDK